MPFSMAQSLKEWKKDYALFVQDDLTSIDDTKSISQIIDDMCLKKMSQKNFSEGYSEKRFQLCQAEFGSHKKPTNGIIGINCNLSDPLFPQKLYAAGINHIPKNGLSSDQIRNLFEIDIQDIEDEIDTISKSFREHQRLGMIILLKGKTQDGSIEETSERTKRAQILFRGS